MKILIINAYSSHNLPKFRKYETLIKKLFLSQRDLLDTEIEFFIRNKENLDDFLYECDTVHSNLSSARMFNFLDMVFLEGEPNFKAWSSNCRKILIFLKMCLLTQKPIFASTCGMQLLVFLCATTFEKDITILNGENGSNLNKIMDIGPDLENKPTNLLLDNVTGDYYIFDQDKYEWLASGNMGIHNRIAAEKWDTIGKYVVRSNIYRPKLAIEKYKEFIQKNYETFCYIKKSHLQHWLVSGVETEFIVSCKNSWDVHPFNFVNPSRTFSIMAENQNGPLMIIIGDNIIGTQFEISKSYSNTVKIFENFIKHKLKDVKHYEDRLQIDKIAAEVKNKYIDPLKAAKSDFPFGRSIGISNFTNQSKIKIRPTSAKTFSHVGFSTKKYQTLDIIDNNAIQSQLSLLNYHKSNKTLIIPNNQSKITMSGDLLKNEGISSDYKIESKRPQTAKINNQLININKNTFTESDILSPRSYSQARILSGISKKNDFSNVHNRTSREIRQMLHPNYNKDNLPKNEPIWIPGNYSQNKELMMNSKKVVVIKGKYTLAQNLFSSKNKFDPRDIDECRKKPIIRVSSPYMYEKILENEEMKKNKEKNKGNDTFKTGKPKNNFIENYVVLSMSEPPGNYKFREEKKEKWVGTKNFRVC